MPKPSKPRGRPRTLDRQRTVDVAMERYWRAGPQALSLNGVCRLAGVSKPGVYREFGGEDGLMQACLERYREVATLPVLELLCGERPFVEVLHDLIDRLTTPGDEPPGCLFTETRLARRSVGPATDAQVAAIRADMRRGFTEWYARARSRGEVDADITPEFAARYLESQLANVLLQMGAGEDAVMLRAQARLALGRLVAG